MDLGLAGKRALVTGGSRGIGLAVTRRLVAEGAVVVSGSLHDSSEVAALGHDGSVLQVEVDLTSEQGPSELVRSALAAGPLDILVNNAGAVSPRLDGFLSVTDEQWAATMTLSFMAAVRTTRAILPHMLERGSGNIVNNASVNASLPDPLVIDYSAAKAALRNFSKGLSKEVGRHGIRVNSVSAGPVSTGLWLGDHGVAATVAAAQGGAPDAIESAAIENTATGRFSAPEEVADLIVFLASDRSANITGADYLIDGGLTQSQ
ncbi:MAG TPA: SDR family oxidoreductase [Acidimicrobiales bacterium]|jgi:NAD(P)-dependent dehydrogenase (short-subunit alcohol dehydrogenase family)|nr:SDR family oxidoreductase [Acidimicrobiales bacterium]